MGCCNVFVVDDEYEVLDGVAEVIRSEGHGATLAGSGLRALHLLRGGMEPSLVLLDLGMPDLDGWTLYEEIKSLPHLKDVPVFVFTGSYSTPPPDLAANYLLKPVPVDELLETVARFCPGHSQTRTAGVAL